MEDSLKYLILLFVFINVSHAMSSSDLQVISIKEKQKIEAVILGENSNLNKKLSCPMTSKSLDSVLAQAEKIRKLFKNSDCMEDVTEIDHVVDSINTVSESLNETATNIGQDSIDNPMSTEINGQQITGVFDNLNNIFYKSKCTLNNKGFLNYTADLVQSFAQMSLLMPNANGLVVAGGGLAASSVLRLIASIFDKDFEFKDNSDRNNFIKLNCSFFDLRRSVENTGLEDIKTEQHQIKLDSINETKALLQKKVKDLESVKKSLLKEASQNVNEYISTKLGNFNNNLKTFKDFVSIISNSVSDNSEEDLKLNQVIQLRYLIDGFSIALNNHFMFKENIDVIMDGHMKSITDDLSISNLLSMDLESYEKNFRKPLKSHLNRIIADLERHIFKYQSDFNINSTSGLNLKAFNEKIDKDYKKNRSEINSYLQKLVPIKERLEKITSSMDYSYLDEGKEKSVSLHNEFTKIQEKIYGKWGNKFLDYVIESAFEKNKLFTEKYNEFFKDHVGDSKFSSIKVKNNEYGFTDLFSCQDAKPLRTLWKSAKDLIESGYDFIITNQSLFHKDLNEGIFSSSSSHKEDIQDHFKSATIAKRFMNTKKVTKKFEKYINKIGLRHKLLGAVMITIEKNKVNAQKLQEIIESKNCVSRGFN